MATHSLVRLSCSDLLCAVMCPTDFLEVIRRSSCHLNVPGPVRIIYESVGCWVLKIEDGGGVARGLGMYGGDEGLNVDGSVTD